MIGTPITSSLACEYIGKLRVNRSYRHATEARSWGFHLSLVCEEAAVEREDNLLPMWLGAAMTPTERRFRRLAKAKGWGVIRPSWPDFLCVHDGSLFALEVKHDKDWVSERQRETFDLLEEHDFPVYIWHSAFPRYHMPWADVRDWWAGRQYPTKALAKHLRKGNV